MYEILLIVYLLVALSLVGLILIQHGKGADMGASFGAGSSNTLFGASGSGNFLTRLTTGLAIAFFVLCLVLGNLTKNQIQQPDKFENIGLDESSSVIPEATDVPASDIPAASIPAANDDIPAATNGDAPAKEEDQ
jgi:preprotein translocase subunit SecG